MTYSLEFKLFYTQNLTKGAYEREMSKKCAFYDAEMEKRQ